MPSKRLKRTLDHPDVKHGTYVTYMNYRCRCEPCVADYQRYKTEYRARNREKIAAYSKSYSEINRDRLAKMNAERSSRPEVKAVIRARQFGITVNELEALLAPNKCAICNTDQPGPHGWHIDHDHACCPKGKGKKCGRCIRGILCHKCNVGLGHFDDDQDRLRAAISYLE